MPKGRWAIRIWVRCEPSRRRVQAWRAADGAEENRPKAFYRLVNVLAQGQVRPLPPPATPVSLDPPPVAQITGETHGRLLGRLIGLAIDENSIPYLAVWARHASLEVLQRAAELARRIEDALADPDANDTEASEGAAGSV